MIRFVMRPNPRARSAPRVHGLRVPRVLGSELAIAPQPLGVDPAVHQCRLDCATRLRRVAAVGEAAIARKFHDVGEDVVDAGIRVGELQLTHAGRVEQPAAAAQPMQ